MGEPACALENACLVWFSNKNLKCKLLFLYVLKPFHSLKNFAVFRKFLKMVSYSLTNCTFLKTRNLGSHIVFDSFSPVSIVIAVSIFRKSGGFLPAFLLTIVQATIVCITGLSFFPSRSQLDFVP